MRKLFVLFCFLSNVAFAEVPPPGTAREGDIEVTPKDKDTSKYSLKEYKVIPRADSRRVQKLLNDLRAELAACKGKALDSAACNAKVDDLSAQLRQALAEIEALKKKLAEQPVAPPPGPERKHHRIAVYGGVAPDGVEVEDIPMGKKAKLHEAGPAFGLSYGYLFDNDLSLTGFASTATAKTQVFSAYLGLGMDF